MLQLPAKTNRAAQVVLTALTLTVAVVGMAHAQGADPLGVTQVKDAVVATFKVLAAIGIVWGFLRMMGGRHTVEGLVTMAVGALGIAKADTIITLLGVG